MISRTADEALIKSLCFELWDTIAEDGISKEEFKVDTGELWLKAKIAGEVVGVFNFHPINSITLQVHPIITKRGKGVVDLGKESLRWIVENTQYEKVVCQIPVIYRHVKLYAMQCGMAVEGNNRRSYLKSGKIHDMWTLGITRPEIEAKCYE